MKLITLILAVVCGWSAGAQTPLTRAHAHNDYEHPRPLLDALEQGFGSVEADIYLVNGELLVAHNREDVRPEKTLEKLYLEPLKKRFDERKQILPGLKTLILLVDIKSEAVPTYEVLEKKIEAYKPMLTVFEGDEIKTNAVTIILSGNRPTDYVAKQPKRWAAIDGRLADLEKNPPRSLVPLISDNWALSNFQEHQGVMTSIGAGRLFGVVKKTHEQGRLLRFWGTADNKAMWELLYREKVDLINTDHLAELAEFLRSKNH